MRVPFIAAWAKPSGFTSYREGDWKLIYHYTRKGAGRYELFNLVEDPYEKSNQASTKPKVLKTMLQSMRRELKDTGARFPVTKDGKTPLVPTN